MPTRLNIVLDGFAPGLQEHALSLSAFGEPLYRLLLALQRIASGLAKDAIGEEYGSRGGRHTAEGSSVDVEIISVTGNSPLELGTRITTRFIPGLTPSLFVDELTDTTVERFLDAVDKESKGQPANKMVRSFLASMPTGVRIQEYTYWSDTGKTRTVTVEDPELAPPPSFVPYIQEIFGVVIGLGFDPGKTEVRLKSDAGTLLCSASPEQVEEAVNYRGAGVRALVVRGGKNRLLGIWPPDVAIPVPGREMAEEYLFKKWDGLLQRLAK
jgi:hypothetical protein